MSEKNQIAKAENVTELKPVNKKGFDLTPQTFEDALKFADMAANSDMVPKDYKGKPSNCLIAMQMGAELGIPPLQALQNISVVNGRPAVWGDLLPALAQAHPQFEFINETFDEDTMTATCTVKRRHQPEQVRTFSKADAVQAKLWGQNTWAKYPKRMLQMRARGFAVRDVFPDALKGCSVAEDIIDLEPKDYSVVGSETQPISGNEVLINDQQEMQLHALITENGLDGNQFCAHAKINTLSELPARLFNKSIEKLTEKAKTKAAESKLSMEV